MVKIRFGIFFLVLFGLNSFCFSQDNDLLPNSDINHMVDRIDILGISAGPIFTDVKPFRRDDLHEIFNRTDINIAGTEVNPSFQKWFKRVQLLADDEAAMNQEGKPFLKAFYPRKRDFLMVDHPNLRIFVNPMFYLSAGGDHYTDTSGTNNLLNYRNTRGIQVRGTLMKKVGFYTEITENQAKYPLFIRNSYNQYDVLFGESFVKTFDQNDPKGGVGYDYFTSRGYITFSPIKDHIRIKLGKDRAFWGNGYQSLFLSDYATDHFMLDIKTRVWKLEYTNHFAQMVHYIPNKPDPIGTFPRKYAALHMLSFVPNHKMTFSLFESVVYSPTLPGGVRGFELEYLNPIIFYRSVEQYIGSPDNSMMGASAKINFLHHFSGYTQLLLDDFNWRNRKIGKGYYGNKYAYQFGLKYIDAFSISRLDLQIEYNRIRPYVYSHFNPYANYSHYGQFLAHSQGANLWDFNFIARYQPFPRWSVMMVFTTLHKGLDIGTDNYGGNIFRTNLIPLQPYNNFTTQGDLIVVNSLYGKISFQPGKADIWLDGELRIRSERDLTSMSIMGSFRMNIPNKAVKF